MPRLVSKGTCALCNSKFSKSAMLKHLQACMQRIIDGESTDGTSSLKKFFHLVIEGHDRPGYWMHLKVSSHARFENLDGFLRDIWLECCGHMSAFRDKGEDIKMTKKLEYVLHPGMTLIHEYDFGSTTELLLRVVSKFESHVDKGNIQILARNDPPKIRCSYYGEPATVICTECMYSDKGLLCDNCAKDHECSEDLFLPVVNSPRMGVCGYTG